MRSEDSDPEASSEAGEQRTPLPHETEEPAAVAATNYAVSNAGLLSSIDNDQLMQELVDRLLDGMPSYTPDQVAAIGGVDREVSKKLWRAMGLANVPDDEVAFTNLDIEALRRTRALLEREEIDVRLIVQLARTLGLATARIADSIVDFVLDRLLVEGSGDPCVDTDAPTVPEGIPASPPGQANAGQGSAASQGGASGEAGDAEPLISALLGELDELVVYLLHRHLVDATSRRLATVGEGATSQQLMVGFADLVGYTALSQELPDDEIVEIIDGFEALAADEVVGAGGRIVKTIGDEIMFSAGDDAGPEIALRLAEAFTSPDQPKVRVGLASGQVVSRSGDLYGPVVNLAARATALAHPGTVVVAPSVRERLADDERYTFRRLRPRRLKGIGFVELSALRRARGHQPGRADA